MAEVNLDFEKAKLLFEYTKFHIGMYTTIATIIVGGMNIQKLKPNICAPMLCLAIGFIAVAGMSGGVIASTLTQMASHDEFWRAEIGPIHLKWFKGETWTYIEHVAFWLGAGSVVLAFLFGKKKLKSSGLSTDNRIRDFNWNAKR